MVQKEKRQAEGIQANSLKTEYAMVLCQYIY